MPVGNPSKQTIATRKYEAKAGWISKSYKLKKEVVEEFIRLRELTKTSLIFISHDLGVVQHLATDLLVMKDGICVESGPAQKVFKNPAHEYTKYLIDTRVHLTESFIQYMKKEEVM